MAKLRLALCITELDVGGAERNLVEIATRLDRRRFDPVVYCLGRRPAQDEASCVPALEEHGITVHCLDGRGWRDALRVTRALGRRFREQRPDLVQTFLFHANLIGRLAARGAGVPNVVCGIRVAERHAKWHLRLDRLTSRWVDRYVCVSESVARFSHEQGGLPKDKLAVIPNGVDLQRYPAQPANLTSLGLLPGRRFVVFVGRLDEQKGGRWLLETAPRWLECLPECDLVIAGKGPEKPALEGLSRSSGIADRVHFLGWRGDVPEILAASQLLVLTSRWEGMPNVVLQAMASRLPVVATDVEGVRELLGPLADSQTVLFGDTAEFSRKILSILADPSRRTELGLQNRLRVEQEFSIERMVRSYEALWEALVVAS